MAKPNTNSKVKKKAPAKKKAKGPLFFSTVTPMVEIVDPPPAPTIPKVAAFTVKVFVSPRLGGMPAPTAFNASLLGYDGDPSIDDIVAARVINNHRVTLTFNTAGGTTGNKYILLVEVAAGGQWASAKWDKIPLA